LAAVQAYHDQWRAVIGAVDPALPAPAKLRQYLALHRRTFAGTDRVCLGGALAADLGSLPEPVRLALQAFYRANENWLAKVIAQGQREGDFAATLEPQAAARALFAAVQGCLAASRLFGDSERMDGI